MNINEARAPLHVAMLMTNQIATLPVRPDRKDENSIVVLNQTREGKKL
jgi:hypothetical protein